MNERRAIEAIKAAYPIQEGSLPKDITAEQQKAANIAGRLLVHAHRRKKRKMGRWV